MELRGFVLDDFIFGVGDLKFRAHKNTVNIEEDTLFLCKSFVSLLVPSLSFCYEKATVALYFGRIRTRLGVVLFRIFRLFL